MAQQDTAERSGEPGVSERLPRSASPPARRQSSWLDSFLERGQRLLIVLALLLFGRWLLDGPVRDWLHDHVMPGIGATRSAGGAFGGTTAGFDLVPTISTPRSDADRSAPPSYLRVPSIRVDTPVKEVFVVDDEWQVAEYAAGYLHGTGLPGSPGNMVIAGHAGLRGGVFRKLGSLPNGADVFIDAGGWRYHYRVSGSKSVPPTQLDVLDPTSGATLTLLTCTDWDTHRLVVTADLVESTRINGW